MKIVDLLNRAINKIVRKTYWFNNVQFGDCFKFWNNRTFDLDIVNLGSTSAKYAFNYSETKLKAANWAMQPQNLVADREILKNYFSYIKKEGGMVLIPLCPFSSLGGYSDLLLDKYYTILNISSIPNGSYYKKKEVMDVYNNPSKYYPIYAIALEIKKYFVRPKDLGYSQKIEDARNKVNSWKKEFSITDLSDPITLINADAISDSRKVLEEIVSFCWSRHLIPYIVLPPVSKGLSTILDMKFREKYIQPLVSGEILEKVTFLNYFEDSDFDDDSLFRDSFCLNTKGAVMFTQRVINDIKLIKK